jgi:hypothetical protein
MNCTTTRRVIDAADNPASLPYEAAGHLEGCGPCRLFAGERERLRKLLLEPTRVSAPANFEAMVARRLAARVTQRRPFWLAPAFYLRAGTAAAALACMILVIQMAWVGRSGPTPYPPPPVATSDNPGPNPGAGASVPDKTMLRAATTGNRSGETRAVRFRRALPVGYVPDVMPRETIADITAQPRALILVRNSGSEREIAVPMVSVGAQPWFSVSLQTQNERGIRTAF